MQNILTGKKAKRPQSSQSRYLTTQKQSSSIFKRPKSGLKSSIGFTGKPLLDINLSMSEIPPDTEMDEQSFMSRQRSLARMITRMKNNLHKVYHSEEKTAISGIIQTIKDSVVKQRKLKEDLEKRQSQENFRAKDIINQTVKFRTDQPLME